MLREFSESTTHEAHLAAARRRQRQTDLRGYETDTAVHTNSSNRNANSDGENMKVGDNIWISIACIFLIRNIRHASALLMITTFAQAAQPEIARIQINYKARTNITMVHLGGLAESTPILLLFYCIKFCFLFFSITDIRC